MITYGYVRVSSRDQNEDRQLDAMRNANVPEKNIYLDKISGKDFNRPMYRKMIRKLRKDDLLYIKSIDRLGRNYREIVNQWQYLTRVKKVDIVVLDMPLLNERTNIKSRQREGIEAAHERGVKFGRPRKELPDDFPEILRQWREKEIDTATAAKLCGVGRSTFYSKVKEYCSNSGE